MARLEKKKNGAKTGPESCYERGLNVISKAKESALDSGTKEDIVNANNKADTLY